MAGEHAVQSSPPRLLAHSPSSLCWQREVEVWSQRKDVRRAEGAERLQHMRPARGEAKQEAPVGHRATFTFAYTLDVSGVRLVESQCGGGCSSIAGVSL